MKKITVFLLLSLLLTPVYARSVPNPFGCLTFLTWNESFNNYMYNSEEKVSHAILLLKKLGISMIRVDFAWPQIEPVEGEYHLTRIEYLLKECAKNNIEVMGVLGYTPAWAGPAWNEPPLDIKRFARFAGDMATRYPQVKYWEVWNEPDNKSYWQKQDELTTYTKLLKDTYLALKSANPRATVLCGSLTDDGLYKFKNLLAHGGGGYFDILNIHPFVDPLNPDCIKNMAALINNFHRFLQKAGYDKKIWITEIGCPGRNGSNKMWWCGQSPTEDEQAVFLTKVYGYLLADPRVEKIFWAFFQDTPQHFHNAVDDFGLIRDDFSAKPSYKAYQKIIRDHQENSSRK